MSKSLKKRVEEFCATDIESPGFDKLSYDKEGRSLQLDLSRHQDKWLKIGEVSLWFALAGCSVAIVSMLFL